MKMKLLLMMAAFLLLASPTFAQTQAGGTNWVAITSGFAMAFAAEGMARNPAAAGAIRFALLLGLIFIESLVLYTLAIIFLKVVPA
jgi:F-type H+-transporting ATPase subunit c